MLLSVEWLRLRSRRVFWVLAAAAVAGIALGVFSLAKDARPPSGEALERAQQQVAVDSQQPWVQEEIDNCLASQADGGGGDQGYPPGFDCERIRPNVADYLGVRQVDLVEELRNAALGVAGLAALAALFIGVSFVGADWSAGVIGTQLLYEPRRGRVFWVKLVVVALGAAVIALVTIAVNAAGVAAIASAWGTNDGFSGEAGSLALMALREVIFAAAAGALGVALIMAVRHSLSVLGMLVGYLFFGEGLLRAWWEGAEPWLLSGRVSAWVKGSFDIEHFTCTNEGVCTSTVTHLGLAGSATYLGVLFALILVGCLVVFRRRDVA